jgi:hypothetical protein
MASVCAELEGDPRDPAALSAELDLQFRGVRTRFEAALAAGAASSVPPRV